MNKISYHQCKIDYPCSDWFFPNTKLLSTDREEIRRHGILNIPNTWGFNKTLNEYSFNSLKEEITYDDCEEIDVSTVERHVDAQKRSKMLSAFYKVLRIFNVLKWIPGISSLQSMVRLGLTIKLMNIVKNQVNVPNQKCHIIREAYWTIKGHQISAILDFFPFLGQIGHLILDIHYLNRYKNLKAFQP